MLGAFTVLHSSLYTMFDAVALGYLAIGILHYRAVRVRMIQALMYEVMNQIADDADELESEHAYASFVAFCRSAFWPISILYYWAGR